MIRKKIYLSVELKVSKLTKISKDFHWSKLSPLYYNLEKQNKRNVLVGLQCLQPLMLVLTVCLFSTKWELLKSDEKGFSFHLKNFIHPQDIDFFYFHLPLIFVLSAIVLEDDQRQILRFMTPSIWVNKNLKKHMVWYLDKKRRPDSKTCSKTSNFLPIFYG